jgi:putative flippase GtrA
LSETVYIRTRAVRALRHPANWVQLGKFCAVGAVGYAINLEVFTVLLHSGMHHLLAAACSFGVAVANNYFWNRVWTFRGRRGRVAYQGARFLLVSLASLGANLLILEALVEAGLGAHKVAAQAVAIVLVTPLNFVGNKLWSFRRR